MVTRQLRISDDGTLTLRGFTWSELASIVDRIGDLQFSTEIEKGALLHLLREAAAPSPSVTQAQEPRPTPVPPESAPSAGNSSLEPQDEPKTQRRRSSPVLPYIKSIAAQDPQMWMTATEVMELCEGEGWENLGTRGADSVRVALDRAYERKTAPIRRRVSTADNRTRLYWLGSAEPPGLPMGRE